MAGDVLSMTEFTGWMKDIGLAASAIYIVYDKTYLVRKKENKEAVRTLCVAVLDVHVKTMNLKLESETTLNEWDDEYANRYYDPTGEEAMAAVEDARKQLVIFNHELMLVRQKMSLHLRNNSGIIIELDKLIKKHGEARPEFVEAFTHKAKRVNPYSLDGPEMDAYLRIVDGFCYHARKQLKLEY